MDYDPDENARQIDLEYERARDAGQLDVSFILEARSSGESPEEFTDSYQGRMALDKWAERNDE
jgi:hypothetical protein